MYEKMPDGRPVTHLGDGAYAVHNGDTIELRANHHLHPTDIVVLDLHALEALKTFHYNITQDNE